MFKFVSYIKQSYLFIIIELIEGVDELPKCLLLYIDIIFMSIQRYLISVIQEKMLVNVQNF